MVKMDSLSIRKTNGVKINAMTDDDNSFSLIVPSAIVINCSNMKDKIVFIKKRYLSIKHILKYLVC